MKNLNSQKLLEILNTLPSKFPILKIEERIEGNKYFFNFIIKKEKKLKQNNKLTKNKIKYDFNTHKIAKEIYIDILKELKEKRNNKYESSFFNLLKNLEKNNKLEKLIISIVCGVWLKLNES